MPPSHEREYKDGMFRALFNTPEKALRLYGDITGKVMPADTIIEISNLDNVLLSKLRNDIVFMVNGVLVVFMEHQSTPNPNMPLRSLQYILIYYEAIRRF